MYTDLTEKIFASKLLNTREKWVMIRGLKKGGLMSVQLASLSLLMDTEDKLIEKNKNEADQVYYHQLQKWHADLEALYHEKIIKKHAQNSQKQHEQDSQGAEKLIENL